MTDSSRLAEGGDHRPVLAVVNVGNQPFGRFWPVSPRTPGRCSYPYPDRPTSRTARCKWLSDLGIASPFTDLASPHATSAGTATRWLFTVTAFLGAELPFLVEPLVAKLLLPSYGGSAPVYAIRVIWPRPVHTRIV